MRKIVSGTPTNLASISFDSVNHKWFRIRESGGTTYWDTSVDGLTWTNRHSVANPIAVTALMLEVLIGTWQVEGSTTSAKFDNLNIFPSAINEVSGTDSGFAGSPDNSDPFASAQAVDFTVQAGDALSTTTYYWRVMGFDPSGSNVLGTWSATRSFTVTGGGGGVKNIQYLSLLGVGC
jgi:hypothetical protein